MPNIFNSEKKPKSSHPPFFGSDLTYSPPSSSDIESIAKGHPDFPSGELGTPAQKEIAAGSKTSLGKTLKQTGNLTLDLMGWTGSFELVQSLSLVPKFAGFIQKTVSPYILSSSFGKTLTETTLATIIHSGIKAKLKGDTLKQYIALRLPDELSTMLGATVGFEAGAQGIKLATPKLIKFGKTLVPWVQSKLDPKITIPKASFAEWTKAFIDPKSGRGDLVKILSQIPEYERETFTVNQALKARGLGTPFPLKPSQLSELNKLKTLISPQESAVVEKFRINGSPLSPDDQIKAIVQHRSQGLTSAKQLLDHGHLKESSDKVFQTISRLNVISAAGSKTQLAVKPLLLDLRKTLSDIESMNKSLPKSPLPPLTARLKRIWMNEMGSVGKSITATQDILYPYAKKIMAAKYADDPIQAIDRTMSLIQSDLTLGGQELVDPIHPIQKWRQYLSYEYTGSATEQESAAVLRWFRTFYPNSFNQAWSEPARNKLISWERNLLRPMGKGKSIPSAAKSILQDESGTIKIPFLKKKTPKIDDPDVKAVYNYYASKESARYERRKLAHHKLKRWISRYLSSPHAQIRTKLLEPDIDEATKAYAALTAQTGSNYNASIITNQYYKEIFKPLSSEEIYDTNTLIESARTTTLKEWMLKKENLASMGVQPELFNDLKVDLAKKEEVQLRLFKKLKKLGFANPGGLKAFQHEKYLTWFRLNFPEKWAKINPAMDKFYKAMHDEGLVPLLKNGLISRQDYETLSSVGAYSPRVLLNRIDPMRFFRLDNKMISITDSGLKPLDEGTFTAIEDNSMLLLNRVIHITQRRIANNKLNMRMRQLAVSNKLPDLTRLPLPNESFSKPPKGYVTIYSMLNGKRQPFFVASEVAEDLIVQEPLMNHSVVNLLSWLTMSKPFKFMVTGPGGPEFAISNMEMDIMHNWFALQQFGKKNPYSSFGPKYLYQMSKDIASVKNDVWNETGWFKDYIEHGGGMKFLYEEGQYRGFVKPKEIIGAAQTLFSKPNAVSELLTRVATYKRFVQSGIDRDIAQMMAKERMNFDDAGLFWQALDIGFPYTKPGAVAFRSVYRAAKEKPGVFMWQVAQVGTTASLLYWLAKQTNPEGFAMMSPRLKASDWVVMLPEQFSITDSKGNRRYIAFHFRKDQTMRAIAAIFENATKLAFGDKIDWEEVDSAIKDFLPYAPDQATAPGLYGLLGYLTNRKIPTDRPIWKGQDVEPWREYQIAKDNPFWIKLGKIGTHIDPQTGQRLKGLSPERLQWMMNQFVPSNNPYFYALGGATKELMGYVEDPFPQSWIQKFIKAPFVRRFVALSNPSFLYTDEMKEAEKQANTRSLIVNQDFQYALNLWWQGEVSDDQIKEIIQTSIPEDKVSSVTKLYTSWVVAKSVVDSIKMKDKSNVMPKRFWFWLANLHPQAAGEAFFKILQKTPNQERTKKMLEIVKKIPAVNTALFQISFDNMKKKFEAGEVDLRTIATEPLQ